MIILGITHPISADTAACLLIDGKIVAMVEEERFTRQKHAPHVFPFHSVGYCLTIGGISLDDVDEVAVGFDNTFRSAVPNLYNQRIDFGILAFGYMAVHGTLASRKIPRSFKQRIHYVNHHLAHAASAFYLSPFGEAMVLTYDGTGGPNSGILGYCQDAKPITVLEPIKNCNSWGRLYSEFTELLGFKRNSHEYKVMGLAAYGDASQALSDFIQLNREGLPYIKVGRKLLNKHKLRKTLVQSDPLSESSRNIAALTQKNMEFVAFKLVEYLKKKTGLRKLVLAGGSALNCVVNGKLIASNLIDDLFVQPISNDAGTALGAAIERFRIRTGKRPSPMTTVYFGPQFNSDQIEASIKKTNGIKYYKSKNIAVDAAEKLAQNKVVGWFQGRMEAGPRSLGNRSILGNPANPEMKEKINSKVKNRECWRPFAPSFLEESFSQFVCQPYASPHMAVNFETIPEKRSQIISAIHIDGTCRAQTVNREDNPKYYELISKFEDLTGIPALLNTSFNLAEEPVVCSPEDALRTFLKCDLDVLAIDNFMVFKNCDGM